VRIIGGERRGAHIDAPPGTIARPMRDQVRTALFNILGPDLLEGASALDLFAGSGSLGLEAISRGARQCVFVERAAVCLATIRKNVEKLGFDERAVVRRGDLARGVGGLLAAGMAPFDLVLMDPPFPLLRRPPGPGEPDVKALLRELGTTPGLLSPGARVAIETPAELFRVESELASWGLRVVLRREYGSTGTPSAFGARGRNVDRGARRSRAGDERVRRHDGCASSERRRPCSLDSAWPSPSRSPPGCSGAADSRSRPRPRPTTSLPRGRRRTRRRATRPWRG
jgi:16S rRNA (guanine(966)-N(2))-methyltransferase RsmD